MIYSELFYHFKTTGTIWKLLKKVMPKQAKIFTYIVIFFGVFLIIVNPLTFLPFNTKTLGLYSILYGLFVILVIMTFLTYSKIKIVPIKDSHINFSSIEKKDRKLLLLKVQLVWLQNLMGVENYNIHYLRQQIEYSKEHIESTKTEFLPIKEIGLTAILLIILNNYFNLLFKTFEGLNRSILTRNTIIILVIIAFFLVFLWTIRNLCLELLNSENRNHKELHELLRRAEEVEILNSRNNPNT